MVDESKFSIHTASAQLSPDTTDTLELADYAAYAAAADSAAYVAAAAAAQLLLQLVDPLPLLPHVLLLLLQLLPPPLPPLVPLLQQMRLLLPRSWHLGPEQGDCRCCYSRHFKRHGNAVARTNFCCATYNAKLACGACSAGVRSHRSLTGLIHKNLHLASNVINLGIEFIELLHNCVDIASQRGGAVAGVVAAAAPAAGPDDAEDAKPKGIEPA